MKTNDRDSSSFGAWFRQNLAVQPAFHLLIGVAVLLLDLVTGPYLLFPILFVIPVMLSAWFCGTRLAYTLAVLLPLGRFCIAHFVEAGAPPAYTVVNMLIRIAVLALFAYLVARTARQTRELEKRLAGFVTMCAWSRTVEFEGEWVSFEEYLKRRFDLDVTHGISPEQLGIAFPGVDFDGFEEGADEKL